MQNEPKGLFCVFQETVMDTKEEQLADEFVKLATSPEEDRPVEFLAKLTEDRILETGLLNVLQITQFEAIDFTRFGC